MTVPVVRHAGEGETAGFGSVSFTIKADGDMTQGSYSLVEASGGVFATPHVHHTREEAFYIIEGDLEFLAGTDTVPAKPGSFLLVPRGTMHGFRSNGESKLLIMHSPAGFERFFREVGKAITDGTFDTAFRDRLAAELELTYHDDVTF